jgi:hypothetical protein
LYSLPASEGAFGLYARRSCEEKGKGEKNFAASRGFAQSRGRLGREDADFCMGTGVADGEFMNTFSTCIDPNQLPIVATSIMTDDNEHEVRCGMCARELYVDETAHRVYTEALIAGSENPFRCELCSEDY